MKILGKLIGGDAKHVGGTAVEIHDSGGKISEAVSDPGGVFECPVLDSYADLPLKLVVNAAGYQPFEKEIVCQGDTDLKDLQLLAVPAPTPPTPPTPTPPTPTPPTPTPPTPAVPAKPWPWPLIVGVLALLLIVGVVLKSCSHPVDARFVGKWTIGMPPSVLVASYIETITIPASYGSNAKVTYMSRAANHWPPLPRVRRNATVKMTKSARGLPSFFWPPGTTNNQVIELKLIDAQTLDALTSSVGGVPITSQQFKK